MRGFVLDLSDDLHDDELVQLIRQHDLCLRKAGGVEHPRRLDAEMREVARIEANANRLMPFAAQFFKDANGVGEAAFQCVDRIDEQQAIVGI